VKKENRLNIRGALLDTNQLKDYLEKIASDHIIQKESDKNTYPIPRLEENFQYITATYELLNSNLKIGISIHPAGEWLLDNYYIIEEAVREIKGELTVKKYNNFLGIANGPYKGYARIYVLAGEIVSYTDGKIEGKNIGNLLKAYQNKKTLNMEEIWSFNLFLKIVLIENIRSICEKIYSSQMQKYKVENIIERIIENKDKSELKYSNNYDSRQLGFGEMKYPFIEYMSYRLKRYGKKGIGYLNILEEQVNKMGTSIADVIKKEHFDIALKKVSIGNCIKSIKALQTINFLEVFEEINGVEKVLRMDPAKEYEIMDYKTKEYYRNKISEISKKTKISEIYIANKVLELSKEYKVKNNDKLSKKSHVGYYLIDKGIDELYSKLGIKNRYRGSMVCCSNTNTKINCYILFIYLVSLLLSVVIGILVYKSTNIIWISILQTILIYIPIIEILTAILQYILGKIVKPTMIPKLNLNDGISENDSTMVVIPTIVKSSGKVKELFEKLEVYYLANKSENIYFTLLGDCSQSDTEKEEFDEDIIQEGIEQANRLNKKYPKEGMQRFQFIYRKRIWNQGEKKYIGWERKRGLLHELNEYMLGNKENTFQINTMENKPINKIKYIITLDADTDLVLNSGLELIGAMAHILNKPELNQEKTVVVDGHALIQPRIGINLFASRKSIFTQIFAGNGGTDSYTNAISDVYQDNFSEGIYTGKGIYDLEAFSKVLKNAIPENCVLSHDLLEGSYLRCGLASDIMLMDGYPFKYNAFINRLHRWIRGDWQILYWIKKQVRDKQGNTVKNPLNKLSKFKILDNLRRSLIEIIVILNLNLLCLAKLFIKDSFLIVYIILFSSIIISTILYIINRIVSKEEGVKYQKTFDTSISGLKSSIMRGIIAIIVLPHKAYMSFSAITKTIYRMKIKQNLLEWTTSEEAEKNSKSDLMSYYSFMKVNVLAGIIALGSGFLYSSISILILGIVWIIAPIIMWYISKEIIIEKPIEKVTIKEKEYILEIGQRTWKYFEEYLTKENNYLPPDNYQEERLESIVDRTSSTNIGLGLLAIISACDLNYIRLEDGISLIINVLETIQRLPKWNGHLYNWYNIKTLEPLIPRYISTVDSGNFIGYLYTVKKFLEQHGVAEKVEMINKIIEETDFSILYDKEKRIFSIGFNIEENKLTDSYYDLLASEARQASLIAIAKKDISSKHWNSLSRTLTVLDRYKGLISWSGTAFEYLMPNINIPKYPGSLLDESGKFMIMSQRKYAKKLGIPWGISESAFNLKDLNSNYQYKAFGIPWLGLKRGLADEMVVSSYGSILAINEEPKEVIKNLKILEQEGMYEKYGFYESIDYTPERLPLKKTSAPVKTYMAHHQGLILTSINNFINDNILQKRFMKNPEIQSIDILLQERMPENVLVTKEKKEKVEKIRYKGYDNYIEVAYNKIDRSIDEWNALSNENYTICMNQKGEGFSKYKDILINRYKKTKEEMQGVYFYIKNVNKNQLWTSSYNIKSNQFTAHFMPDKNEYIRQDGNIKTTTKITVDSNDNVEIRTITLENRSNEEELLEITGIMEPVLSNKEQDYAHKAYNNLFLKYEYEQENIIVKRNGKKEDEPIYLGVAFHTDVLSIGDLEYEIDKEKMYSNEIRKIPKMIQNSLPFSKRVCLVTQPIVALKRTIKIKPEEKVTLNYIIAIEESKEKVIERLQEYKNSEKIRRTYELANAKVKEEARYLRISSKEIMQFQKMLSYIVGTNPIKSIFIEQLKNKKYQQSDLWKYGISGDNPIILVKIKDVNDIHVVKSVLKAYDFFNVKNIKIDLIFVCDDENVYEQYVRNAIQAEIFDQNLAYMQNINGGIYILNEKEIDIDLFLLISNLLLDAGKGSLDTILQDLEEEYLDSLPNVGKEKTKIVNIPEYTVAKPGIEMEELKYYNEYGGFTRDRKEYIIKINKNNTTPVTWSHVIANENFGSVVTANGGGFTWSNNSRLNRLTAWSNDPLLDIPSEIIYLKDKDINMSWSLAAGAKPDDNDYYITFGFGYSQVYHSSYGIIQEVESYIPRQDAIKVNLLKLKNTTPDQRKIKLVYYIKPVLGEDEIKTNGYIHLEQYKKDNIICARTLYGEDLSKTIYISSNQSIISYTGSKKEFGEISDPIALNKVELSGEDSLGKDGCIAIELEVELKEYENKEVVIILGEEENVQEAKKTAKEYQDLEKCYTELEKIKQYWNSLLRVVQVKTPLESMNITLNGWMLYQTIVCRLWARSGFYQSGGAFGYRDQLQDTIGTKYITDEFMKEQIIKCASHQFIEGDVEHWWHEETEKGIRTRFSDDLLWLVYVVLEYIELTGKEEILEITAPYLEGDLLKEGEDERYQEYRQSNVEGAIYEHCTKAIKRAINLGEHDLPKIGSGDWNDGFSTVGNKGSGESVWLGFFLYDILQRWIEICKKKNDIENILEYQEVCRKLKKSLNGYAWDGKWFKRAITDDGKILGSIKNEECRIDSIAQSWSVISTAGDNDKKYIAMDSLDNYLVNNEYGIIKLLDPPFEKSDLEPGYIKNYLPGVRENGGQYTHGAIWAIIANTMLGFGDKALEYFRMINPIEHSRTKEMANIYKVEPYVIAADIYGARDLIGRGGWTWYTGSSSWYYKAGIEYILGLRVENYVLKIKPCIPKEWKEYQIHYQYGSSIYHIKVENPNGKNTGVERFICNGQEIIEKQIKLIDNGKINEISIIM